MVQIKIETNQTREQENKKFVRYLKQLVTGDHKQEKNGENNKKSKVERERKRG